MAELTRVHFPVSEPIGADVPDFDLGNTLVEELKAGRISLQRARETTGGWAREGRIALAREATRRFQNVLA